MRNLHTSTILTNALNRSQTRCVSSTGPNWPLSGILTQRCLATEIHSVSESFSGMRRRRSARKPFLPAGLQTLQRVPRVSDRATLRMPRPCQRALKTAYLHFISGPELPSRVIAAAMRLLDAAAKIHISLNPPKTETIKIEMILISTDKVIASQQEGGDEINGCHQRNFGRRERCQHLAARAEVASHHLHTASSEQTQEAAALPSS